MRYRVEQRIQTLAHNTVMKDGGRKLRFLLVQSDMHIGTLSREAWSSDYWLAEATIDADDYTSAFRIFRRELNRVGRRRPTVSGASKRNRRRRSSESERIQPRSKR